MTTPDAAAHTDTLTELEQDALACRCHEAICPLHNEASDGYVEHEVSDLLASVARIKAEARAAGAADLAAKITALAGRVSAIADSIHGDSGWEHNSGCEGEPDCFACIELDLRAVAREATRNGDG
jgi:hypothetical protein